MTRACDAADQHTRIPASLLIMNMLNSAGHVRFVRPQADPAKFLDEAIPALASCAEKIHHSGSVRAPIHLVDRVRSAAGRAEAEAWYPDTDPWWSYPHRVLALRGRVAA
jgi:hypothetical protein